MRCCIVSSYCQYHKLSMPALPRLHTLGALGASPSSSQGCPASQDRQCRGSCIGGVHRCQCTAGSIWMPCVGFMLTHVRGGGSSLPVASRRCGAGSLATVMANLWPGRSYVVDDASLQGPGGAPRLWFSKEMVVPGAQGQPSQDPDRACNSNLGHKEMGKWGV